MLRQHARLALHFYLCSFVVWAPFLDDNQMKYLSNMEIIYLVFVIGSIYKKKDRHIFYKKKKIKK